MEPDKIVQDIKDSVRASVSEDMKAEVGAQVRAAVASFAPPAIEVVSTVHSELRSIADAMTQKRAISLSGAGAYLVLKELQKVIITKYDLLNRFRFIYGGNAVANIPVLTARPARPAKQTEGATGISADSTAAQSYATITPYCYYSEVLVSAEQLVQGAADMAAELPGIFADAFGDAMLYGALVGDSTMTGVFADAALTNDQTCGAAGKPTWGDFIDFAGTLKTKNINPVIITNPVFVGNLLASTSASTEGLKMELLTKGSIRGVPVIESGLAPATYAAGNICAVGLDPSHYVIAMARELQIEPLRTPGTAATYFQATSFFNGKPVLAANGYQLEAV